MIGIMEFAAAMIPLYLLVIDIHRTIGRFGSRIETNEEMIEEIEDTVDEHERQLDELPPPPQ